MTIIRTYRAGSAIEDYCRACKTDRMHTVMAASGDGHPIRVVCGYCRSEHQVPRGAANRLVPAGRRQRLAAVRASGVVPFARPAFPSKLWRR